MDDIIITNNEMVQKTGSVVAGFEQGRRLTPVQAIRAWCLDCSGGVKREARLCVRPECPLYPYRMGTRPRETRVLQ